MATRQGLAEKWVGPTGCVSPDVACWHAADRVPGNPSRFSSSRFCAESTCVCAWCSRWGCGRGACTGSQAHMGCCIMPASSLRPAVQGLHLRDRPAEFGRADQRPGPAPRRLLLQRGRGVCRGGFWQLPGRFTTIFHHDLWPAGPCAVCQPGRRPCLRAAVLQHLTGPCQRQLQGRPSQHLFVIDPTSREAPDWLTANRDVCLVRYLPMAARGAPAAPTLLPFIHPVCWPCMQLQSLVAAACDRMYCLHGRPPIFVRAVLLRCSYPVSAITMSMPDQSRPCTGPNSVQSFNASWAYTQLKLFAHSGQHPAAMLSSICLQVATRAGAGLQAAMCSSADVCD